MSDTVLVAAVQAPPVFLDREATIERACALLGEAVRNGAGLAVFPEAFVPGYPDWVWRTSAWRGEPLYRRLWDQAVTVGDPAVDQLAEAAADPTATALAGTVPSPQDVPLAPDN